MTPNYSGYWTGTFQGTNQGGFAVDIHQIDMVISGTAKFSEQQLGQYEYSVSGSASDSLSLNLVPVRASGPMNLGTIQAIGSLQSDGLLSGRWKSTVGTEGVFELKKE